MTHCKLIFLFSLCLALAIPALTQPTVTVVATFPNGHGHAYIPRQLMQGGGGNFYGATAFLGANNAGTIFLMNQQGNLKILFSFDQLSGSVTQWSTRGRPGRLPLRHNPHRRIDRQRDGFQDQSQRSHTSPTQLLFATYLRRWRWSECWIGSRCGRIILWNHAQWRSGRGWRCFSNWT